MKSFEVTSPKMAVEQDCLPLLLGTKYHLKTNLAELEVINQSLPQSLHSGLVWAPFSDPAQAYVVLLHTANATVES